MQDEKQTDSPDTPQPESNWQFNDDAQDTSGPKSQRQKAVLKSVNWTASEFIHHDKTPRWYFALAIGTLLLTVLVYLLTHDNISAVMVVIVAVIFGAFAARQPRQLEYSVDEAGVHIGEKLYPYSGFKSFSIMQEDAIESIWFMPLKRFMPIITIYFDPKDGQKITDVLSGILPLENRQLDAIDKLMHYLRF